VTYVTIGGLVDVFVFMGPTYQDVVRQYHKVIGHASLLPLWSNGFAAKSSAYVDAASAKVAVDAY
jgi:alpha-glucosidase